MQLLNTFQGLITMNEIVNYSKLSAFEIAAASGYPGTVESFMRDIVYKDGGLFPITGANVACSIIRSVLSNTLFRDPSFQLAFTAEFDKKFPSVKCTYDTEHNFYLFRIKKTSIKKIPDYEFTSSFYCTYVSSILKDMISMNKDYVLNLFRQSNISTYCPAGKSVLEFCHETFMSLVSNEVYLGLLFDVLCFAGNTVEVRL